MITIKDIKYIINLHYNFLKQDKHLYDLITDHLNKYKSDYNNFYDCDLFDNIKSKHKFKTLYIKFLILSDIASVLNGDLYYHDRNFNYQRNLILIIKNSKLFNSNYNKNFIIRNYNKNTGMNYNLINDFILKTR